MKKERPVSVDEVSNWGFVKLAFAFFALPFILLVVAFALPSIPFWLAVLYAGLATGLFCFCAYLVTLEYE